MSLYQNGSFGYRVLAGDRTFDGVLHVGPRDAGQEPEK